MDSRSGLRSPFGDDSSFLLIMVLVTIEYKSAVDFSNSKMILKCCELVPFIDVRN